MLSQSRDCLVNSLLVRVVFTRVKRDFGCQDGQPYVQTMDERVPETRAGERRLRTGDRSYTCTGSQLLFLAKPLMLLRQ